jgi:transcriptional regulator with PAS, ATPase and Fis domain
MPPIQLDDDAQQMLESYNWPGNIRQLKNITEQISVIEHVRNISRTTLQKYLPEYASVKLPAIISHEEHKSFASEREILYKILFDMKNDMNDLKKLVVDLLKKEGATADIQQSNAQLIQKLYQSVDPVMPSNNSKVEIVRQENNIEDTEEVLEESLSLSDKEIEMIKKALEKHSGKRKLAASELGISERTLYRKIKEYNLE